MRSRPQDSEINAGRAALERTGMAEPAHWLLASVVSQTLWLMGRDEVELALPISTGATGIDAREGSGGTPPGLHRIAERIGAGARAGAEFLSRRPTGRVWSPDDEMVEEDLILSRVLTLEGLEPGVNSGPGIDSKERYIYLHGTNCEDRLGEAVSHGCLRLANADIIDLFDRVAEGDLLVIV